MKVIIDGSRSINDFDILKKAIVKSTFMITEVVSGGAKGADLLGEKYALEEKIPCTIFKALWNDLNVPNAIIKTNDYGKYNVRAGTDRNIKMGDYADALIAIWDGSSTGTKHMIEYMNGLCKKVFVYNIKEELWNNYR